MFEHEPDPNRISDERVDVGDAATNVREGVLDRPIIVEQTAGRDAVYVTMISGRDAVLESESNNFCVHVIVGVFANNFRRMKRIIGTNHVECVETTTIRICDQ